MSEQHSFDDAVAAYRAFLASTFGLSDGAATRIDSHVECLRDWSPNGSLEEARAWFAHERANCTMRITDIPLADCRRWQLDPATGFIRHDSGDFFYVQGLRVQSTAMREVSDGWDQPMLTQVGFDGGILGLLRQRHHGVPMYLVEAKAEPGNYQLIQLSPTVQATFANLRQSHGGRVPRFAEYFQEGRPAFVQVLFDQWLSEDGGRLTNKRNRGMLVEVPAEHAIELPSGFRWMSLWQLKALLQEDAWVNPHIRGIIAHL